MSNIVYRLSNIMDDSGYVADFSSGYNTSSSSGENIRPSYPTYLNTLFKGTWTMDTHTPMTPRPLNKLEVYFLYHGIHSLGCIKAKIDAWIKEDAEEEKEPDAKLLLAAEELGKLNTRVFTHIIDKEWELGLATLQTMLHLIMYDDMDEGWEDEDCASPSELVKVMIGLLASLINDESLLDNGVPEQPTGEYLPVLQIYTRMLAQYGDLWLISPKPTRAVCPATPRSQPPVPVQQLLNDLSVQLAQARRTIASKNEQIAIQQEMMNNMKQEHTAAFDSSQKELKHLRVIKKAVDNFCRKHETHIGRDILQQEIYDALPKAERPVERPRRTARLRARSESPGGNEKDTNVTGKSLWGWF